MPARVIAVTGGIGAGKSSLCAALATRGAEVLSADESARRAVAPGTQVHEAMSKQWPEFFRSGDLDRAALASAMFADTNVRQSIEALIHPWVRNDMASKIAEVTADVAVADIPLLAETRSRAAATRDFDYVVSVWAPQSSREERLVARGMTIADARLRIAVQATDEQRNAVSDVVIPNVGQVDELAAHAVQVLATVLAMPRRRA